ncbi:MAG TPA: hypothetical protein DCS93_04885 [Microscillaceae bacterium]|nr:hypothetical protein [Microscillaceae bacterium]
MNKALVGILLLFGFSVLQIQAQCPEGMVESHNLVVNGDFSEGNRYFSSGYRVTRNLGPEGTFQVGAYPTRYHHDFRGRGRAGRNDQFMIVNGSPKPNTSVWCQQVKVKPKTHYNFSAWIATLVIHNPAKLHFSINGQVLGANINAPYSLYQWKKFDAVWYSGEQTSATICIVNLSTIRGGNDFGLDDIRFTSCIRPRASIPKKRIIEEAAAEARH